VGDYLKPLFIQARYVSLLVVGFHWLDPYRDRERNVELDMQLEPFLTSQPGGAASERRRPTVVFYPIEMLI
jgi:hypothetical protein